MSFEKELWFGGQSEVTFVPAKVLPESIPVTAVKIFDITNSEVLLVQVPEKGGWDIPGGHVEEDESPELAAVREVKEETNGRVHDLTLFGYMNFRRLKETERTSGYPEESLIAMYIGKITDVALRDDDLNFEATKLAYFDVKDVSGISPFWTKLSQQIIDYAMKISNE
jgi:8-oxo-dGTP pyrophosphatase MutT (NUDIX family)